MVLLEDTRNQIGKHVNIQAYCQAHGIEIVRTKLAVGDYTLPTDQSVCVDTKQDMKEVYGNLTAYQRFHNEYTLAEKLGIKLIILIEDMTIRQLEDVKTWHNPIEDKWRQGKVRIKPRTSTAIYNQMRTIQDNHNLEWAFCHPRDTGETLIKILTEKG